MRFSVSSQHHRPPNYLISGHQNDPLIIKEWVLLLRGDGKSPRTIEGYTDSVRQLASFLQRGGFPALTQATAEHIREWLNDLRERGNRPATINTRYRGAYAFYKWLVREGEIRENPLDRIEPPRVPEAVLPYYRREKIGAVLESLRGTRCARGGGGTAMLFVPTARWRRGRRRRRLCYHGDQASGHTRRSG